ncbi:hypothetical protein ABTM96_19525, partial [Acinetobacter baumannii]
TINAQNTTDLAGFGGVLALTSGSGNAGNGHIDLTTAGAANPMLRVYPAVSGTTFNGQTLSFNPTFAFDASVSGATIKQNTVSSSGIQTSPL